jgi:extracellular solute-binding protein
VTLNLTDFWGAAEGEWIKQVITDFEKKYPNVKIQRKTEDWGQLNSTLNLQLQDAGGPDIATANNGWQSLGTLAKGGLVLNLDAYAKAYGWDRSVPTTIARQNQFSTDFKTMGSGSWFATPMARTSLIGLYYNADKLKSLGLQPPQTLADLEADAAKAKAAGQVPFEYGSQDGSTTVLLGVQALLADKTKLNDYIYGNSSSWRRPAAAIRSRWRSSPRRPRASSGSRSGVRAGSAPTSPPATFWCCSTDRSRPPNTRRCGTRSPPSWPGSLPAAAVAAADASPLSGVVLDALAEGGVLITSALLTRVRDAHPEDFLTT